MKSQSLSCAVHTCVMSCNLLCEKNKHSLVLNFTTNLWSFIPCNDLQGHHLPPKLTPLSWPTGLALVTLTRTRRVPVQPGPMLLSTEDSSNDFQFFWNFFKLWWEGQGFLVIGVHICDFISAICRGKDGMFSESEKSC